MNAYRRGIAVGASGGLALLLVVCAGAGWAAGPLPADDAWTETIDVWRFHHEDKDSSLCKPVKGKTLLIDEENKTTGKASIRFRYLSAEALKIRTDIPQPTPRQIYNVLRLPNPPVDARGYDALELDLRCVPDGAVVGVRVLIEQRPTAGRSLTVTAGPTAFRGSREWRRYGVRLADMAALGAGAPPPDWAQCTQIIVDVRLATDVLGKTDFADVWLDGLRFIQGKSAAAEGVAAETAAAARPPGDAGAPFPDAPEIPWEDLGVMVRGRATLHGSPDLGFSTGQDGWSAYAAYRDHIVKRKPWMLVEVNLQTGKVKRFPAPAAELSDTWGFEVFPDGRPYTFPTGGGRGARIARLDWKTGQVQLFGPCPDDWNYCWRWSASDKAIYVGGYRQGYAVRFDPETGAITDLGRQGPEGAGPVMSLAADATCLYSGVGRGPSYLVACDKRTKDQRILGKLEYPQSWSVNGWAGEAFPRVQPPTYKDGVATWQEYRVVGGRLEPLAERPRWSDDMPREAFGMAKPELLAGSARCLGDGWATLWFRLPGKAWQSLRFAVDDVPSYLFRLGLMADGKIIGSSQDPYTIFTYDPDTGRKELLGPPPNDTHVYSFLSHPNGLTYMCGYSGAPLFAWNPGKPWNYQAPTPEQPMRNWKDPALNPLQVARMYRQRRAFKIVLAADGRLYVPCSAYVETFPGGGLGWYDPKANEAGIIREGFETQRGNDACVALNGRYVVVATIPWPATSPPAGKYVLADPHDLVNTRDGAAIRYRGPEGDTGKRITPEDVVRRVVGTRKAREVAWDKESYLLTYDTETLTVVGRLPIGALAGMEGVDGTVCEWKPGWVAVRLRTAAGTRFGLLDVLRQKVEFKLELPGGADGPLLRLPDGRIASLVRDVIVFLNPKDWSWQAVGRLRPSAPGKPVRPSDWILRGNDLYLYCDTQLARIKDVGTLGAAAPKGAMP